MRVLRSQRSGMPRPVWVQRAAVVGAWVLVILLWQRYQALNDLGAAEVGQRFIDAVENAWWGVLAFIAVYMARPLVLFPASLLTVVGGLLFGPVLGVAVVVVAANGSALVGYLIGRLLRSDRGGHRARALEPGESAMVSRWGHRLRTRSFETVFVMRLLFLPYDLVNVLSGALAVRIMPFVTATALGSLPGTLSFVLLGASLERVDAGVGGIEPWTVAASVAIFLVSIGIARALRSSRLSGAAELGEHFDERRQDDGERSHEHPRGAIR